MDVHKLRTGGLGMRTILWCASLHAACVVVDGTGCSSARVRREEKESIVIILGLHINDISMGLTLTTSTQFQPRGSSPFSSAPEINMADCVL